jgi:hypothetical protein
MLNMMMFAIIVGAAYADPGSGYGDTVSDEISPVASGVCWDISNDFSSVLTEIRDDHDSEEKSGLESRDTRKNKHANNGALLERMISWINTI